MPAPDPAAMAAAIGQKQAALLAQCPPAPATMSPDEAREHPIHVVEAGDEGPVVLIVHGGIQGGLGGGPATFDEQKPLGERGWRLRLMERPGFGQTASRGVDDMEADAAWTADMLGDGAHLVGHSWGGAVALLAAARRPGAVRSLTLIEPAVFPIVMADPALRADPEMMAIGGRLVQLMMGAASPADYAIAFARTVLGPPDDKETKTRVAGLEADREMAGRVGCALLQARMAAPDALRAAAQVVKDHRIPVLTVSGGWTPFFDRLGPVVAQVTDGEFQIVPAANHMVQSTAAPAFNDLLDGFMRRNEAGRGGSAPS